ncbi:ABC transporter permease [Mesorhizobium sp. M2A.F.Ca.ET.037.01.1.1]|uniref:ABC transporter permease n=1 Tax=unclassified Mesorhizobium TaxID=325217 RepID=UPI000FCC8B94|nr:MULTISPECIES: ABC transporter permease [unclassified Mesorhizobium]RUX21334.1 ABC transporter permease [Mesorhizobium sp. M2A.F.Ca.ET.037.01.1.1]RUY08984.1 ABC transporter permease [Mesorhizobium sp. M2A.F.Ca.ET.040.01.1.1]RWA92233.1 MAG: ABC transporter permease [Mesorhizobium sp.]TIV19844.1 MAG: ABC transporter permease [Mesorhizobium sp.]
MAKARLSQEGVVFALAVALFVVFAATLNNFLTAGNLIALVRSVSILGILGLGMGLVVIGRGIDLAMVATMVVSLSWVLSMAQAGMPFDTALVYGALLALVSGLGSGILIAYADIPAIFTTLAMGLVMYGSGRAFLFQIDVQNSPAGVDWFDFLGRGAFLGLPMPIVAFAVLAALVALVLMRTRFGRFVYAAGDNALAARITGLPLRPLIVAQYVISALIAFLAGVVMAAAVSGMSTRVYNSTMIYDVLLVVVLGGISLSGGRGSVRNVLVGTLLVGVLLNGMTILDITYTTQNLIKSLILLLAITVDSFINPRDEQTSQQSQGDI